MEFLNLREFQSTLNKCIRHLIVLFNFTLNVSSSLDGQYATNLRKKSIFMVCIEKLTITIN